MRWVRRTAESIRDVTYDRVKRCNLSGQDGFCHSAFASVRSAESNPSVNQPYTSVRSSRASRVLSYDRQRPARQLALDPLVVKHRFMETISALPYVPTLYCGGMVGNPDAQGQRIESVVESSVSIKQKNVDPVTMSTTRDRECRTDAGVISVS